jgi:hypothetical protein
MKYPGHNYFFQVYSIQHVERATKVDDSVHMISVSGEVIAEVPGVALKQLVQQLNFDEQYSILLV